MNICRTCGHSDECPRHVCVKPFTFDASYYPPGQRSPINVPAAPFGCALCDVDPESSKEVRAVVAWLAKVARLQLDKNRKYKESLSRPVRIFSKSDPAETIRARIDDKLSRVASGAADEDEDVLMDLAGYIAWLATSSK